ncbi:DUF1688-domain-containing protein [Cantharellus anzutake]|uniref:DUF1688-domain-containing protein n=1 Tax=Cantharellus anzutake TaxID=1750568 RepID=UPI001903F53C|nr:DUF1688-domain-containing protein [Cantharellus anzutake]KAF8332420.1 DUF1688-domain-containing protein [Cantharellus anzutake]
MNISLVIPPEQKAAYLQTLPAIRERCSRVHGKALQGKLHCFEYFPEKEDQVVDFCIDIIKRDFGENFDTIPPHGRWRHLDAGRERVRPLLTQWKETVVPVLEQTKRLVDLILVSVLLDAGAGNVWTYTEKSSGKKFARSEGLAVASFDAFVEGHFSGDREQPFRVDAAGLSRITVEKTTSVFQVDTNSNLMAGLEGRTSLLVNLAGALKRNTEYFGPDARPEILLVSYFLQKESQIFSPNQRGIHVASLFHALIYGLRPIWPVRNTLAGVALGDVWHCAVLNESTEKDADDYVPFHKLTQWLTYSLVEPIEKVLGWTVEGLEDMTGLPEYRNGGLLVDFEVLKLKKDSLANFYPDPSSNIPQTWATNLSLPQILESATWKGGREIAKQKRPSTGGPPIDIESDGTVF